MKIAVLVSGGVDSSVALTLLKNQGHEVTAFYLKIWLEDELSFLGNCPWEQDLEYVQALCEQLDVSLEVISFQKEYWDRVVSYTMSEAKAGRTPNPDILCNQQIKFGAFLDKIDSRFEKVATGHYAQIKEKSGQFELYRAPDAIKDQTYFLSHLRQDQLARALFPIGHLAKEEVRVLAHTFDLPTKDRKDSQGICFLGKVRFDEFLKHHLGEKPGPLVEVETGKNVGNHRGFWFYTIGQRQGLGLAGGPWYVVGKNPDENTVFISRSYYSDDKTRNALTIGNCNWISGTKPTYSALAVKLRHGKQLNPSIISFADDDSTATIRLSERDQGIAPGQFAVLYDGEQCLGGGTIQSSEIMASSQASCEQ